MNDSDIIKTTVLALIEEQKALRAKVDALETLFFAACSFVPVEQLEPVLRREIETRFSHDLNAPISDQTIDVKAHLAADMLAALLESMRRVQGKH
jgi:hypothetical protein